MGCLALNASYEPLTLVPARRAIRLVLDHKAEILEVDDRKHFRSERNTLPCPTVIRLVRFVHVPRRFRRQVTNTFLFARDDYSCQYCGRHRRELRGRQFLTRDHVTPVSQGGGNAWENVVTACSPCNNRKGNHTPAQAGMPLRARPGEPNYGPPRLGRASGNGHAGALDRDVLRRRRARSTDGKEGAGRRRDGEVTTYEPAIPLRCGARNAARPPFRSPS